MPRWAVVIGSVAAGVVVIVLLGVFVFGSGDEATTADETQELRVTVRDGEPLGGVQHLTVRKGEEVKVRVESDVADEIHVHGYELAQEVAAGGEAEIEFEATIPGRFEIELEQSGTPIAELEVRP